MLLEAHKNVFTNWELSEEEMLQRARAKKEQVELEQELFGNHGEVSSEEYEQIYRQTGLDVDGREKILRIYANCMELQIRGFVHFAKGIPGFRSLPLDDQVVFLFFLFNFILSLFIVSQLYCSIGNSPMENPGCLLWGKLAAIGSRYPTSGIWRGLSIFNRAYVILLHAYIPIRGTSVYSLIRRVACVYPH